MERDWALIHAVEYLTEALQEIACKCTIAQRDSGHLVDCSLLEIEDKLVQVREALR